MQCNWAFHKRIMGLIKNISSALQVGFLSWDRSLHLNDEHLCPSKTSFKERTKSPHLKPWVNGKCESITSQQLHWHPQHKSYMCISEAGHKTQITHLVHRADGSATNPLDTRKSVGIFGSVSQSLILEGSEQQSHLLVLLFLGELGSKSPQMLSYICACQCGTS